MVGNCYCYLDQSRHDVNAAVDDIVAVGVVVVEVVHGVDDYHHRSLVNAAAAAAAVARYSLLLCQNPSSYSFPLLNYLDYYSYYY